MQENNGLRPTTSEIEVIVMAIRPEPSERVEANGTASGRPRQVGRFIVLEGLSCVGKSTIAPLLADALGGTYFETVVEEFEPARRYVDAAFSPAARLHFWMMANYALSERVRSARSLGKTIVVESYFFRTLATHAAMGVYPLPTIDWSHAALPDVTVLLTVAEAARQQRLRQRERAYGLSRWSRLQEQNIEELHRMYQSFGLQSVDTTSRQPHEVVADIEQLIGRLEARHACD